MSGRFARDTGFGATVSGAATRFRLWAPAQQGPALVLDDSTAVPMHSQPDGWFGLETSVPAGARYRYRLDDGTLVPDPASRFQPEDVHGPSAVIDPRTYRWRHELWAGRPWHEAVIYEAHAGCLGGFNGVAAVLPRLARPGRHRRRVDADRRFPRPPQLGL